MAGAKAGGGASNGGKPGAAGKSAKATGGVWSLFGPRKKIVVGKLGNESNMYYHPELKCWVERGKEHEAAARASPPPPLKVASNSSLLDQAGCGGNNTATKGTTTPASNMSRPASKYALQDGLQVSQSGTDSSSRASALIPIPRPATAGPMGTPPKQFFIPGPAPSTTTFNIYSAGAAAAAVPAEANSPPTEEAGQVFADGGGYRSPYRGINGVGAAAKPPFSSSSLSPVVSGNLAGSPHPPQQEPAPDAGENAGEVAEQPPPALASQHGDMPPASLYAMASGLSLLASPTQHHQAGGHHPAAVAACAVVGWADKASPTSGPASHHPPSANGHAAPSTNKQQQPLDVLQSNPQQGPPPTVAYPLHPHHQQQHSTPSPQDLTLYLPHEPLASHQGPRQPASTHPPTVTQAEPYQAPADSHAALGALNKGHKLLSAVAAFGVAVASRTRPVGAMGSGADLADEFERIMHPGAAHKLDGPLPWELPDPLKHSDQFITICSNWHKNNPGLAYSHQLLLDSVMGGAGRATSPARDTSTPTPPLGGAQAMVAVPNTDTQGAGALSLQQHPPPPPVLLLVGERVADGVWPAAAAEAVGAWPAQSPGGAAAAGDAPQLPLKGAGSEEAPTPQATPLSARASGVGATAHHAHPGPVQEEGLGAGGAWHQQAQSDHKNSAWGTAAAEDPERWALGLDLPTPTGQEEGEVVGPALVPPRGSLEQQQQQRALGLDDSALAAASRLDHKDAPGTDLPVSGVDVAGLPEVLQGGTTPASGEVQVAGQDLQLHQQQAEAAAVPAQDGFLQAMLSYGYTAEQVAYYTSEAWQAWYQQLCQQYYVVQERRQAEPEYSTSSEYLEWYEQYYHAMQHQQALQAAAAAAAAQPGAVEEVEGAVGLVLPMLAVVEGEGAPQEEEATSKVPAGDDQPGAAPPAGAVQGEEQGVALNADTAQQMDVAPEERGMETVQVELTQPPSTAALPGAQEAQHHLQPAGAGTVVVAEGGLEEGSANLQAMEGWDKAPLDLPLDLPLALAGAEQEELLGVACGRAVEEGAEGGAPSGKVQSPAAQAGGRDHVADQLASELLHQGLSELLAQQHQQQQVSGGPTALLQAASSTDTGAGVLCHLSGGAPAAQAGPLPETRSATGAEPQVQAAARALATSGSAPLPSSVVLAVALQPPQQQQGPEQQQQEGLLAAPDGPSGTPPSAEALVEAVSSVHLVVGCLREGQPVPAPALQHALSLMQRLAHLEPQLLQACQAALATHPLPATPTGTGPAGSAGEAHNHQLSALHTPVRSSLPWGAPAPDPSPNTEPSPGSEAPAAGWGQPVHQQHQQQEEQAEEEREVELRVQALVAHQRAQLEAELKAALQQRTAELEAGYQARASELEAGYLARALELEALHEARVGAANAQLRHEYEQQLADLMAQVEDQRERCEATQSELDELLLCLGQESTKVGALTEAMLAAGLDPGAVVDPIEAEYAVMSAGAAEGDDAGEEGKQAQGAEENLC